MRLKHLDDFPTPILIIYPLVIYRGLPIKIGDFPWLSRSIWIKIYPLRQGSQSTSFRQGIPRLHAACSMAMPDPKGTSYTYIYIYSRYIYTVYIHIYIYIYIFTHIYIPSGKLT